MLVFQLQLLDKLVTGRTVREPRSHLALQSHEAVVVFNVCFLKFVQNSLITLEQAVEHIQTLAQIKLPLKLTESGRIFFEENKFSLHWFSLVGDQQMVDLLNIDVKLLIQLPCQQMVVCSSLYFL